MPAIDLLHGVTWLKHGWLVLVSEVSVIPKTAVSNVTPATSIINISSYIKTTITWNTIIITDLEEDIIRGPPDSITTGWITPSVPQFSVPEVVPEVQKAVTFPGRKKKRVVYLREAVILDIQKKKSVAHLHSWHFAGFIISALMTAAGLISYSIPALMSGLGILIITVTSIYEIRKK
jgi:hypothetical protein